MGSVGVAAGVVIELLSDTDDSTEAAFIIAGLSIVVLLALTGFVAGWFGRERDDVVITAIGAGLVAAVALATASVRSEEMTIASVVLAGGVAVAGGAAGVAAWWIGDLICDGRDLPTAGRLVAPAYAEDHPGYPLWTTDAGPAIRTTLDQLADRVAPGDPVDGRAVGIVAGLPRDVPVVVLLAGDQLAIQPVDLAGAVNGDLRVLRHADITEVTIRSVRRDGTERRINAYDDVITINGADGSHTRLRLPYGTRGVGPTTGGPEVIRQWFPTRTGLDR
ncbi:MAG TPA: hypothetical protein VLN74_08740 [Ilumatobacteraceae bacterium]|nr:hypothetical protein [Ilumatobacteraceae bacterium]